MNKRLETLKKSLQDLIVLIKKSPNCSWIEYLEKIDKNLANDNTVENGLVDLENCFGGMGSLNDLFFCKTNKNLPDGVQEKEFNNEFDRLLTVLYKHLQLAKHPSISEKEWDKFEKENNKDIPLRINKTFK